MNYIKLLYACTKKAWQNIRLLSKGQKNKYALMQLAHRIEKGMVRTDQRPMWGWDKAYEIDSRLKKEDADFASLTARAVLSAYLDMKANCAFEEDRSKVVEFLKDTRFRPVPFEGIGGRILVKSKRYSDSEREVLKSLFESRHSAREFTNMEVSDEIIEQAVSMALKCPSACNRQPFHVYVLNPKTLEDKLGKKLQYKSNKTLIITGDVRAFTSGEMFDWVISPTIFMSYLTLSLHAFGIGSCVVRKDLLNETKYNRAVRMVTGMPESECVVLELFIGYYKDEYLAPVSNRLTANEVISFIR